MVIWTCLKTNNSGKGAHCTARVRKKCSDPVSYRYRQKSILCGYKSHNPLIGPSGRLLTVIFLNGKTIKDNIRVMSKTTNLPWK